MNPMKLEPPRPVNMLLRERLMNKLHDWDARKVVFVHGQAGQGKSTLAAGYVQTLTTRSVWYNLDQDDENPILFLTTLAGAIQRAWPTHAPRISTFPPDRFGGDLYQAAGPWIEQIFGNLPKGSLIVLDDFQGVPAGSVLPQLLQSFIDRAPSNVRFMIISRMRPGLDTTKLRAAQSLGEISGDDLRFTDAEVQDLFGMVFRMQISPTEAGLINATTEGWPAGLVLMHDHLASLPAAERSLALNDRRSTRFRTHVFDYLAQEVFAHLPTEMRNFLLATSITDYLPAALVPLLTGLPQSAPSGRPSVESMVRDLQRRNLFITATDPDSGVVRYHALFREFLRKKLHAMTNPRTVQDLYSAAAAFFRKSGDRVRSIDLVLGSGKLDHAVREIEACGEQLIGQGQTQTLIRWIEMLPLEYGNRPWFLFYRAVACRFTDPGSSLTFYELALSGFRGRARAPRHVAGAMLSLCGIIEACFHSGGDFNRMGRAAALAKTLLGKGGREAAEVRPRLLLAMGMAWFFIGRLEQGIDALSQALDLFRRKKDNFYQITSAIYLAPCALYRGDFRLARDAVRMGFEAQASIPDDVGSRAALFLIQAMTSLFEGDFDGAQSAIDRCKGFAIDQALASINILSLEIEGWLRMARGDYAGAEQVLAACGQQGEASRNEFFMASAAHLLAISHMFQGRLDAAKAKSDYALSIRTQSGSTLFHAIYLIADGAILFKLGKNARAEKELRRALSLLRRIGAAQQEANAHLVLARLYRSRGMSAAALRHLKAGFTIGQTRGFTYYALFDAGELRNLAADALTHGICGPYCAELVDDLSRKQKDPYLQIHVLGGFRVLKGKKPIRDAQWKSSRAKQFVKLLAARDGYRMPREMAMEVLWPDASPNTRRLNMNSLIHRLRKMLGPDGQADQQGSCILLKDDVIMLDSEQVWTDSRHFDMRISAAERAKTEKRTDQALAEYEKALMLYQGDFLPDDLYDESITAERDRLRTRYFGALENAARLAESSGDRDRTLRYHQKRFLADPCSEKACRWLMLRHQSDGRRDEAIRTYEQCERALAREMDLEPDEQTRKIFRSIIGG